MSGEEEAVKLKGTKGFDYFGLPGQAIEGRKKQEAGINLKGDRGKFLHVKIPL